MVVGLPTMQKPITRKAMDGYDGDRRDGAMGTHLPADSSRVDVV